LHPEVSIKPIILKSAKPAAGEGKEQQRKSTENLLYAKPAKPATGEGKE
jgi:hypothetical protein